MKRERVTIRKGARLTRSPLPAIGELVGVYLDFAKAIQIGEVTGLHGWGPDIPVLVAFPHGMAGWWELEAVVRSPKLERLARRNRIRITDAGTVQILLPGCNWRETKGATLPG